jgi:membrane-associated phospholipid phosphatase
LWQGRLAPWIGDALSAAYLSYQVYVHWAFISAWFLSTPQRMQFARGVFTTFAVGFTCYFLLPAETPQVAFPQIFDAPQQGGLIMTLNEMLNSRMAARYDAFPSMHVLVTMTLLAWDWGHYRVRFWIMLLPAVLMAVGTLYLRLHYLTDLMASAALFIALQYGFRLGARSPSLSSHAAVATT